MHTKVHHAFEHVLSLCYPLREHPTYTRSISIASRQYIAAALRYYRDVDSASALACCFVGDESELNENEVHFTHDPTECQQSPSLLVTEQSCVARPDDKQRQYLKRVSHTACVVALWFLIFGLHVTSSCR